METIAILGPGAVGGLLAAVLARAGSPVRLIGREPTVSQIAADGITVQSPRFGTFTTQVPAQPQLSEPAAVLVVATKAPQLEQALERITVQPAVVVPLLNGIDHVDLLRARFSCPVIPATINVQTYRDGPSLIVHRLDLARVSIAAPGHDGLEAALTSAGFDLGPRMQEAELLWRKLCRLCALALATTARDAPLGEVREDAYAVAREAVAVANAAGASVELDAILAELRDLGDQSSSSLRVDVAAGQTDTELMAIAGPVLSGGAAHSIEVPTTARLVATIQARIHR